MKQEKELDKNILKAFKEGRLGDVIALQSKKILEKEKKHILNELMDL